MSSNRITTAVLIIGGALVFSVTGYAVGTTAASSDNASTECYEQLVRDWQEQANDQLEIHKRGIDMDIERELSGTFDSVKYRQWQDDLQVVLAHKLDLDLRTCTK